MKKITYLVAPLMVLPFLVGCGNKAKGLKIAVSDANDAHLKFTTEDGKDLRKLKVKKGKELKFRVEATTGTDEEARRVVKDYVFAAVDGTMLYDGVTVVWDNENSNEADKTKATVTIAAEKVTGDVLVGGLAGIEGYYIYDLPYLAGIRPLSFSGDAYDPEKPGYAKIGNELNLVISLSSTQFGAIYKIDEGDYDDVSGYSDYVAEDHTNNGSITINGNKVKDSIFIFARSTDVDWLDYFSWDQIREISDAGLAQKFFVQGDRKTITVNGHDHEIFLVDFNHDCITSSKEEEPKKAGITFMFATLISDANGDAITTKWGDSHQDFRNSTLNGYLNSTVLNDMLPPELKAEIKTVFKKVGVYDTNKAQWEAQEYETKLFPLSAYEFNQADIYTVPGEGTPYTNASNFNAGLTDANGTAHNYWLRSPSTQTDIMGYTRNYSYLMQSTPDYAKGYVDVQTATTARSIAPAFCI